MFTGIVEAVGTIRDATDAPGGRRLQIETAVAAQLGLGDSVAVNGVCLTVIERTDDWFTADIGPETAHVTNLGAVQEGQRVNLERPLRLDGRLGGHLVLGHVDGIGTVQAVRADANSHWVTFGYPDALSPLFISKGSVTVDGVSVTIARLGGTEFDVQVIPYTWQHTIFSGYTSGDRVNLECDMIGKYVARAIELSGAVRRDS